MSDAPTPPDPPAFDRRSMDPHLSRLERRLDLIDDVLRGDTTGHPGIVESVRQLSSEQRRQGEELALLRAVPSQLEHLTRAASSRDESLEELAKRVQTLVDASTREQTLSEGERQAVDKIGKWLKIGAGLVAVLLAGGATSVVALLRELGQLAALIP